MFQYALGRAMAKRLGTTLKLDLDFLLDRTPRENFVFRDYDLDIFNLSVERALPDDISPFFYQPKNRFDALVSRLKKWWVPYTVYREAHFHVDPAVFLLSGNIYLEGYWQSAQYFQDIEDEIRTDFSFRSPIAPTSKQLSDEIENKNSVCVNVRRADFLNTSFHGVCDMKYFGPAVKLLASRVKDSHFFVFSDDPEWCLNNFNLPYRFTFVGHEHKGEKFSSYLQLMARCKHFIIPNSSFAWWAVWMNRGGDKIVVAPTVWFTDTSWDTGDLIPKSWIRIEN
ncbi:MAG: alpha-1,2-fucosyltransferase [Gammaproteobacteria bacterium]|nr:alpha-1,2-fucosyltransferase [Gammaproteobacteria bacterium]